MHRPLIFTSLVVAAAGFAACGGNGDTASGGASSAGGAKSSSSAGGAMQGGGGEGGSAGAPASETCQGSGPKGYNKFKNLYFGDLHQHTSYSLDAYSFGTRNDPPTAYLFAKGKQSVPIGSGTTGAKGPTGVHIDRPLDFLAVTDHSEWLAVTHGCVVDTSGDYYNTQTCDGVRSENPSIQSLEFAALAAGDQLNTLCGSDDNGTACVAERKSAWSELIKAADTANDPCSFTALVAYEWTGMASHTYVDNGMTTTTSVTNHRNVIFADDHVPDEPIDSIRYETPPKLWTALESECTSNKKTPSCDVVTIPHNTNLSAGESLDPAKLTPDVVAQQRKFQVSAEMYQHKGSSECYYDPSQGYADADCQFEYVTNAFATDVQPNSFLRTALENGIAYQAAHPSDGNPFELGFVGATDDHNGAPGHVLESDYTGHAGRTDDLPSVRLSGDVQFGSGALTGVWAEENTRPSIFGAIKRRETFAVSGPRIGVRFFATPDAGACSDPDFPKKIVDAGNAVPMGGELGEDSLAGGRARFAVAVFPDPSDQDKPDGTKGVAKIAAVQIIKAHVPKSGGAVVEDAPQIVTGVGEKGGCATYTDATFSKSEIAVYYVRVLQEPTWRWSHYDCASVEQSDPSWQTDYPGCAPGGGLDVAIQERAWTSPIWFSP